MTHKSQCQFDLSTVGVVVNNGAAKFCGVTFSSFQSKSHQQFSALEWWKKWDLINRDAHLKQFAILLGRDIELEEDIRLEQATTVALNEVTSTLSEIIFNSSDKYSQVKQLRNKHCII